MVREPLDVTVPDEADLRRDYGHHVACCEFHAVEGIPREGPETRGGGSSPNLDKTLTDVTGESTLFAQPRYA